MKLAFISSEIFPYSKTGGLGDVSSALPKSLKNQGLDVVCIAPLYKKTAKTKEPIESFEVVLPVKSYTVDVFEERCEKGSIYLLSSEIFERDKLYGTYSDNYLRFGLFCYAATTLSMKLGVSIMHINDWQSAFCAYLVKKIYKSDIKTVLTIHNIAYQGVFPKSCASELGILEEDTGLGGFEFYNHINLLKGGIVFADFITTVSKNHLLEIQKEEFGYGLDGLLREFAYKSQGITNGIDTEVWDPANDKYLAQNYDIKNFSKKKLNKVALCEKVGLEDSSRVLFVMVSRMVREKGIEFIRFTLPFIKDLEANFLVMGEGDGVIVDELKEFALECENFVFINGFDEKTAHLAYGAGDFLMMPSLFEPCGLNQLIALKYGTIPLVRSVGGLSETICDIKDGDTPQKGRGIVFDTLDSLSFYHALTRSLALFTNTKKLQKIAKKNMSIKNGWDNSSKEYIKIYKNLTAGGK